MRMELYPLPPFGKDVHVVLRTYQLASLHRMHSQYDIVWLNGSLPLISPTPFAEGGSQRPVSR